MGKPFIDLTNQQFGFWTVTGPHRSDPRPDGHGKRTKWFCTCVCGNTAWVDATNLRGAISTNCGCKRETTSPRQQAARQAAGRANRTHGYSQTKLYRVWAGMIQRCHNPSEAMFKHYGARGIEVCERWRQPAPQGFLNFLEDMPGWKPGLSIERIDFNGNYGPENCCWLERRLQTRNTRRNIMLPNGINLGQYCEDNQLEYDVAWHTFRAFKDPKYRNLLNLLRQV